MTILSRNVVKIQVIQFTLYWASINKQLLHFFLVAFYGFNSDLHRAVLEVTKIGLLAALV